MEKIYKATMRAFGAKPNGSDKTSCVNDAQHVKQILALVTMAFTFGAITFGYKGLPDKVRCLEDKIVVIPEGVEERYCPQSIDIQEIIKKRYHINEDFIFTLSTLEPRKNQARLIKAFKLVKETFPNLQLIIAGRTGWGEIPEPVSGVLMPGYVPDADLPGLYSGCLAFVLPSIYEGFGLPPLQAMACGAAVAVSNISSLPEVVGEAGVLFDPESVESIAAGIIEAIKNRGKLKEKSLAQAAKFTWEKTAKETYRVYQQVLDSKK